MIEITGVSHSYGDISAVSNVSLEVKRGELHGLLGPDGAGKTTLLRILTSLIPLTDGRIVIDKIPVQDYARIRTIIGYMPQRFSLYSDLSVEENLEFFANIFSISPEERRNREKYLYRFSNLSHFKSRPAGKLSGGMKQKLALMCALVHSPKVLILDEPTTGVDPVSREEFWHILHGYRDNGIPILVSTPYMDEAGQCDRVTLMNKGKVLITGNPRELISQADFEVFTVYSEKRDPDWEFLTSIPGYIGIQPFGKNYRLYFKKDTQSINTVKEIFSGPHFTLKSETPEKPNMEDIFIYFMEYGGERSN
jgi:ABC-type multidrug transport system ATPase subunit